MNDTERLANKISKQVYGPDKNWFVTKPEDEDRMHGSFWRYTPCEALRHVYELIEENPIKNIDEIKFQIRVASAMTKCLAKRLTIYEGRGWGRKLYPMTPWWRYDKLGCVLPGRRG